MGFALLLARPWVSGVRGELGLDFLLSQDEKAKNMTVLLFSKASASLS